MQTPKTFTPIFNRQPLPILDLAGIYMDQGETMIFPAGVTKEMAREFISLYIEPIFGKMPYEMHGGPRDDMDFFVALFDTPLSQKVSDEIMRHIAYVGTRLNLR
jgi:hypothetical protein